MLADKVRVVPEQIGELLLAVGVDGGALTVTVIIPLGPGQPLTVAVTEYVPEASVGALVTVGFCREELKLLGPVQA